MAKKATKTEARDQLAAMQAVASRFAGFKPASEVLTRILSVPTIFPQYDIGTRCGGHPIERITLVHGPSQEGKTSFVLGLMLSFLMKNHFAAFVDAEFSTPIDWVQKLFKEMTLHPGFVAARPKSFEKTRDSVKNFAETICEAREKGEIDPETTGLIVVDSIKKLIPERLTENLEKEVSEGKVGLDGMGGRAGQYKAALVGQWLDELVPLLYHAKLGLVLIAREYDKTNASVWETSWKAGGGSAPFYEASVAARVTRSYEEDDGEKNAIERHCAQLYKLKTGAKEGKATNTYFHTSNGLSAPEGFYRARDVLEMAEGLGGVERTGSIYNLQGERFKGRSELLKFLREQPEVLDALETECRKSYAPPEVDHKAA